MARVGSTGLDEGGKDGSGMEEWKDGDPNLPTFQPSNQASSTRVSKEMSFA